MLRVLSNRSKRLEWSTIRINVREITIRVAAATELIRIADALGIAVRGRIVRSTDSHDISTIWYPMHVIKITKPEGALQATSIQWHALTTICTILDAGQSSRTTIAKFNAVLDRQVGCVRVRLRCERGPIRTSPDAMNRPILALSPKHRVENSRVASKLNPPCRKPIITSLNDRVAKSKPWFRGRGDRDYKL